MGHKGERGTRGGEDAWVVEETRYGGTHPNEATDWANTGVRKARHHVPNSTHHHCGLHGMALVVEPAVQWVASVPHWQ